MVWLAASTLSGPEHEPKPGTVKLAPSAVTVFPEPQPAAVRSAAAKLVPIPSPVVLPQLAPEVVEIILLSYDCPAARASARFPASVDLAA